MTVLNRTHRLAVGAVLALTVVLLASLLAPSSAGAARTSGDRVTTWTAAAKATITPGVMMYTAGAQCTANFVYTDAVGNVYVGYAAHCAGKGAATDTNGCDVASLPLGTKVTFVKGGSLLSSGDNLGSGTLAYSSWLTEAKLGTTDPNTCAYNDLALVKVDRKDLRKVNPSVPFWGGPSGIDRTGTQAGDRVYTYGNSSLRGGLAPLSPHLGVSLGDSASDGGWSHPVYTVLPGIPGDSGSAFMTAGGKAIGTLSTLGLAPLPLSNNIGDLFRELTFAQRHSGIRGLQLTNGTVKFSSAL